MSLVYLDTETTGLNPMRHQIWEIAYAVDGGPIRSGVVAHDVAGAEPVALEINRYWDRVGAASAPDYDAQAFESELRAAITDATLVGANPAFDAAFLATRWDCWGVAPWKYRMLDIETYAAAVLDWPIPRGLKAIAEELGDRLGWNVPPPDHTAAGDVRTTRAAYEALRFVIHRRAGREGATLLKP